MLVGELPEDRRSAPKLKNALELTAEFEDIALEHAKEKGEMRPGHKRHKRETSRVPQF